MISEFESLFRRSTDAAFFAYMDAELVAEPRTNLFLATDCAATEEHFRERYGEAVMVNRDKRFIPSIPNRPKDNQRDAVIDMFALARTRKILGNSSSSFSQVAAEIGGTRVFRVLEEKQDRVMRRALRFSGKTRAAVSSATYWRPKGLKQLIRRRKLRPLWSGCYDVDCDCYNVSTKLRYGMRYSSCLFERSAIVQLPGCPGL